MVEEFGHKHPGRFRYRFEPQQGTSYAFNAGIREARGDILAFVDDDMTIESTWLQNLTAVLHDKKWAGAGGRVLLKRTFTPPRWLSLEGPYAMGCVLAFFDRGDKPSGLDWAPYRAGMAFRREMFEKYGAFRADLGHNPDS